MALPRQVFIGLLVFTTLSSLPSRAGAQIEEEEGDERTAGPTAGEKAVRFFGPRGPQVLTLTLSDCIARALRYNPELLATDFTIEGLEAKRMEAQRIGHPVIDYEYNLAPVPQDVDNAVRSFFSGDLTVFNRFKFGVGVPVHTFGKVKLGKELATLGISAERERKNQKKSDTVLKVKQLYYGIQLGREVNRLLKAAHRRVKKEIDRREEKGGSDPSELLKLKLFRAELEKRIEEADKKEILAKEALRTQTGLDDDVLFDLDSDRLRPVEADVGLFKNYLSEAYGQRSDLKMLEIGQEVKERQLSLEKRMLAPNLGVGAFFEIGRAPGVTGVTTTDDFSDPFNFTRAGIGMRLEGKFDFHGNRAKRRQVSSEIYRLDVQKDYAEDGIELEVKEAFLELQNATLEMERADEANRFSRQLLFLTQSNFDIGLADSKDLIDAVSSFLETRGRYFEAVFHYNIALADLEKKVGRIPEG